MFAHTLARDMGRVDVDGMMDDMSLPQFMRWAAYYQTGEPLVPWAFLAAAVGNMMGSKKRLKPSDFLPRRKRGQTGEEMGAVFSAFAEAHNKANKNRGAK